MQSRFSKLVVFLFLFLVWFLAAGLAEAQEEEVVEIHFFWSKGCPHCVAEKPFLESLADSGPNLRLKEYEISERRNADLFIKTVKELDIGRGGVFTPLVVIGDSYFIGFLGEETHGPVIRGKAEECLQTGLCPNVVGKLREGEEDNPDDGNNNRKEKEERVEIMEESPGVSEEVSLPDKITLPFLGSMNAGGVSLPIITFSLALVDGFNPCAMWALVFLISMLIGMENRRRMWLIGATFIVTSAVVYFLFLAAWLNLFLLVGFLWWVRLGVGLAALSIGFYNLREFYVNRNVCKVVGQEGKAKLIDSFERVVKIKNLGLVLLGVVALAVSVNAIELVCSAGLPAIYTQVLSLANLPIWKYYIYLVFYVVVFMLDDLVVFVVAMVTLKMTGLDTKYQYYSRLIGGVIMLVLGLILLFKPDWLMFG